MITRVSILLLCAFVLHSQLLYASPSDIAYELSDSNMEVSFEVHAPWNILDGFAKQLSGNLKFLSEGGLDKLRVEVSAEKIEYKAGLSVAGQAVGVWFRANPPTPAKFIIGKSTIECNKEAGVAARKCKGSVEGELTIWAKLYNIDIPLEITSTEKGVLITGLKEIKWGEYGFGDPNSTIANLRPVIDLSFSVELAKGSL